jgi:UTP--glucose-1-phosphate uridylyltransferase
MSLGAVDERTAELLDRFGFDAEKFDELRAQVASGALSAASNVVSGVVGPPAPEDVVPLPEPGSDAWREARDAGLEALAAGRVAQVVLAGGMATRFGGVVKGVVEALDGRSFLGWKLGETGRLGAGLGVRIPVALMTSFATDEGTRAHVAGLEVDEPLWFSQRISLRLTVEGQIFEEEGRASAYAPGHGDLLETIRASGTLAALRGRGVEQVAVSNVDNLGARLDPVVVGAHLLSGRPMTTEVARKEGDMGGAPARVDGRIGLLEGPEFPADFDQDRIPVFNTNTALFELDALDRAFDLRWLVVRKSVDGREAVQLEHLYHHASWELETTFLEVTRSGPRGRFFPIKEPVDLERSREGLREMLSASVLD